MVGWGVDIGVIGLGTAGGAAATFFARAGHAVSLYERVPEPGAVGAGIVLQPTGMAVLARLGLVDDVVGRGAPLDGLRCLREDGRAVVELVYGRLAGDLYGVGLHRGVLFEALSGAARSAGVSVTTGVEIVRLARARGGRRLLVDSAGRTHGPFDLVVVGDGARSRLAAQVAPSRRTVAYPWGALWFVGHDEPGAHTAHLLQYVHRAERMTGFLPTGLGPRTRNFDGDTARELPLVSLYYSLRADRVAAFRDAGLAPWKRRILGFAPHAEALLAQIREIGEVLFTAYHDVTMWPYDDGDAVVLGDAAHAMSPQLGQGANLALWDAAVLADCVEARPGDVAAALDLYSHERRAHLDWFQRATRWLTPFFQGDAALLGWLRDAFMPLAGRLPWARGLMLASMAGTATGLFSRLPLKSRPPARTGAP